MTTQRENEARLQRRRGMSAENAEWIEQETKDLQWYAFREGKRVKGTKAELLAIPEPTDG